MIRYPTKDECESMTLNEMISLARKLVNQEKTKVGASTPTTGIDRGAKTQRTSRGVYSV